MNPATIIRQAEADGVKLVLSGTGVRAVGKGQAVTRWLPILRQHKAELVAALKTQELVHHLRLYADRNGFSEADFDEALEVAMRNPDSWLQYIRGQNETRH